MHPCLKTPEIQHLIFENLSDVVERPALLKLALSCPSFTGTALDILWRDLGSLEPLLAIVTDAADWNAASVPCDVNEDVWSTLHYYGQRIRNLRLKSLDISAIGLLARLSYRPRQVLLSRIHRLVIWLDGELPGDALQYIPTLLGRDLKIVYIRLPLPFQPTSSGSEVTTQQLSAFAASLARNCPAIEEAHVQFKDDELRRVVRTLRTTEAFHECNSIMEAFVEALPCLKRLEYSGHRLSTRLLHHLGAVEGVLSLDNTWYPYNITAPPPSVLITPKLDFKAHFLSLESLTLNSRTLVEILPFLELSDSPLTRLNLMNLYMRYLQEPDNTTIINIGKAWPQLESLAICFAKPPSNERPKVTTECLGPLFHCCKGLERLVLMVDCDSFKGARGTRSIALTSITFLEGSSLQERDIQSMIDCLDLMFPRLRCAQHSELHPVTDVWRRFNELALSTFTYHPSRWGASMPNLATLTKRASIES